MVCLVLRDGEESATEFVGGVLWGGVGVWGEGLSEGEGDFGEGGGDLELVPGAELPFAGGVDGDGEEWDVAVGGDGGGAGVDGVAWASWAVDGEDDGGAVLDGTDEFEECGGAALAGGATDDGESEEADEGGDVFAVAGAADEDGAA